MYGSFSDTKDARLGSIELSVKEGDGRHPRVGGVGAIVIGGALLLVGGKKGWSRLPPRG